MQNHVETDGKGGLKVVITETQKWVLDDPALLSSIYLHESTQIDDMKATDPKMGTGFFAG